jgi:hypothetical protein
VVDGPGSARRQRAASRQVLSDRSGRGARHPCKARRELPAVGSSGVRRGSCGDRQRLRLSGRRHGAPRGDGVGVRDRRAPGAGSRGPAGLGWGPDSGPGIGPRRRRPRRRCWCVPGTRCRCTGAPCTRVGMHWVMRRRLVDPGPAFAAAVTALGQRRHWEPETLPRVSVLPVGGLLEVAGRPLIGARTASGDASKPGSVDVGTGAAVTTRRLACCLASRSTPQCATERHRGR